MTIYKVKVCDKSIKSFIHEEEFRTLSECSLEHLLSRSKHQELYKKWLDSEEYQVFIHIEEYGELY